MIDKIQRRKTEQMLEAVEKLNNDNDIAFKEQEDVAIETALNAEYIVCLMEEFMGL